MITPYYDDVCDELDAGLFGGDMFFDWEAVQELERYMARWQQRLNEVKQVMREDPEQFGAPPE